MKRKLPEGSRLEDVRLGAIHYEDMHGSFRRIPAERLFEIIDNLEKALREISSPPSVRIDEGSAIAFDALSRN